LNKLLKIKTEKRKFCLFRAIKDDWRISKVQRWVSHIPENNAKKLPLIAPLKRHSTSSKDICSTNLRDKNLIV